MKLFTNTSGRTFRRCPKEYFLRYVLGYVSVFESFDLLFGTLIHAALEVWWLSIAQGAEAAITAALHTLEAGRGSLDEAALVRARCMMAIYHARWFDESAAEYEVLGVEREFRAPLINPDTGAASKTFQRAGKLDLFLRHLPTGRILVGEHKTAGVSIETGSDYWAKLTMDAQVSGYLEGAKALGFERIDGCLYDVLAKPKHEPLKATPEDKRQYTAGKIEIAYSILTKKGVSLKTKKTTEANLEADLFDLGQAGAYDITTTTIEPRRLYADQRDRDETLEEYEGRLVDVMCADPDRWVRRGIIVRLENEAKEAAFDDWQTAVDIRVAERTQRWPRHTDSCFRFNRKCDYWEHCANKMSLDTERFEQMPPHRELNQEEPQQP